MLLGAMYHLSWLRTTSPGCPCVWAALWFTVRIIYSIQTLSWLGWDVLSCLNVSNSHMKQFGIFPRARCSGSCSAAAHNPSTLTFALSRLSPGQVAVEVIQFIRLLLQGFLQPEEGSNACSLPVGIPLLHQSEELGEGLMVTIPQHVHADVLLVWVPVTGNKKQTTQSIILIF